MRQQLHEQRFLESLTAESELYAIFGRGFPHSFYKAYVRVVPNGKWWRIKNDIRTVAYNPHKEMAKYPLKGRLGAIIGPVGYFLLYENIGYDGLVKLQKRLIEVCGAPNCHLQIADGPHGSPAVHDEARFPQ